MYEWLNGWFISGITCGFISQRDTPATLEVIWPNLPDIPLLRAMSPKNNKDCLPSVRK